MVVFTCNHCGDSIQKPKAEKHYDTKCRNNYPDLCCVDCLKDFRGDEFKAHTKCISEAERYGGKGFVAKANQNKGENKQNAWIEIVQSVLDDNKKLSGSLRNLLERVSNQPNTPRKKQKFYNFVRSMDGRATMKDIEAAWELLSAKLGELSAISAASKQNGNTEDKESNDVVNKKDDNKKQKKNKNDTELTENETGQPEENGLAKKQKKNKNVTEDEAGYSNENGLAKKQKKNKNVTEDDAGCLNENGLTKKQKKKMEKEMTNGESMEVEENATLSKKERKEKHKREKSEAESRKRKIEEINELEETPQPKQKKAKNDGAAEFNWQGAILSVLGSKGNDISLKKLQKRVFGEYCSENNVTEITERITKKFNKMLYKLPNVKVENGKVCLTNEN